MALNSLQKVVKKIASIPDSIASNTFQNNVKNIMEKKKCSCMDAVLIYCEENNIDEQHAGELIRKDPILKVLVQADAENLNFIKKSQRLPV